jgi:biotin synthase
MMRREIFLCAINNLLSGMCGEDCRFCSQSFRYRAKIERYGFKKVSVVVKEAKVAKSNGAVGYCLVTSGKSLSEDKLEYISSLAYQLKRELVGLKLIACCGTASREYLKELKKSGIDSYNHNLETSKEYYPQICSTHNWSERYQTCENIKSVGLSLCSGGIFGMGENQEDRESFIESLLSLKPDSIPINFYIPNPSLPIKERSIDRDVAIKLLKSIRSLIDDKTILMVAGGRESIFGGAERVMFEVGVNSIVIGNYLTTEGVTPDYDRELIKSLGYGVVSVADAELESEKMKR